MSVWRGLMQAARGARRPRSVPDERSAQLPEVDAFVEISVNGSRRRESVAVDAVDANGLTTRAIDGLSAGDGADFLYTNNAGRFRFATTCTRLSGRCAFFAVPRDIKTIESFANRRAAPRVPWLGPAQWRYAPNGRGSGEFFPASMMDLSSAGSALVVDRPLRPGTQVEVRFRLDAGTPPLCALSQVVRASDIETSTKSAAGIAFIGVGAELQRMLVHFVSEQQAARRERGVV